MPTTSDELERRLSTVRRLNVVLAHPSSPDEPVADAKAVYSVKRGGE